MALILTFSHWEKELMGVPSFILFIPVTAKRSLVLLRKRCIYGGMILEKRLAWITIRKHNAARLLSHGNLGNKTLSARIAGRSRVK